jgi:hypothetical protein
MIVRSNLLKHANMLRNILISYYKNLKLGLSRVENLQEETMITFDFKIYTLQRCGAGIQKLDSLLHSLYAVLVTFSEDVALTISIGRESESLTPVLLGQLASIDPPRYYCPICRQDDQTDSSYCAGPWKIMTLVVNF